MQIRFKGNNQRGAAFGETALVAPLLLLLIFGTIDLARVIRAKQAAVMLSREAVALVSRDCSHRPPPVAPPNPNFYNDCIQTKLNSMRDYAKNVLPQGGIVVTIIQYGSPVALGQRTMLSGTGTPPSSRLANPQLLQIQGASSVNPIVTISEAIGQLDGLVPLIHRFGSFDIYEVAEM